MRQRPAAILFDLDGTLLDSAPHFTTILNDLLTQAAMPLLSLEQVRPVISGGVVRMLQRAFGADLSDAKLSTLKKSFLAAYERVLACSDPCYFAGVEQVIQALNHYRIPFGIVTNKHQCYAECILDKAFFKKNLATVIYGDTLKTPKPSPEPLYLACQRLAVPMADTWFVGDGRVDMLAAKAAGSVAILAAYGYVESDWQAWPAEYVLHELTDVLSLL